MYPKHGMEDGRGMIPRVYLFMALDILRVNGLGVVGIWENLDMFTYSSFQEMMVRTIELRYQCCIRMLHESKGR
jgi:hypothetical protein